MSASSVLPFSSFHCIWTIENQATLCCAKICDVVLLGDMGYKGYTFPSEFMNLVNSMGTSVSSCIVMNENIHRIHVTGSELQTSVLKVFHSTPPI